MHFPVSGVDVAPWIPPLVALVISFFTSMGGVSGAFLLLPFQVSVLGFDSPAVSPTNLIFNMVAIPSGVCRYVKEGRMAWPLTWAVTAGTLPGVAIGAVVRVLYLPDPRGFKFFVAWVLLYIGLRLAYDLSGPARRAGRHAEEAERRFHELRRDPRPGHEVPIRTLEASVSRISYGFYGEVFSFSTWGVLGLSLVVGIVGGMYGIGGGAIVAPFFVAVFHLPVHTVAGAALAGTFITSVFGVLFYQLIVPLFAPSQLSVAPDWALGFLFGAGGLAGMYLGARCQKLVSARYIKAILAVVVLSTAARYLLEFQSA